MKTTVRFSILMLLFLSVALIACKKKEIQYTFEGNITENLGNTPLSSVKLSLFQRIISNGLASETFDLVASTTTDSNGNFAVSIDRDKVLEFKLKFEKPNYFPLELVESSAEISTENVNMFNETLDAKSWISLEINNLFPLETDHFKLILQRFRENCDECAVNTTTDFYGSLDTTLTYATTAGEYVRIIYVNVTAGTSTIDSVYTTPFETISYPIVY